MRRHGVLQATTGDDRRQRAKQYYTGPYTMCRRASNRPKSLNPAEKPAQKHYTIGPHLSLSILTRLHIELSEKPYPSVGFASLRYLSVTHQSSLPVLLLARLHIVYGGQYCFALWLCRRTRSC